MLARCLVAQAAALADSGNLNDALAAARRAAAIEPAVQQTHVAHLEAAVAKDAQGRGQGGAARPEN